MPIYEYRCSKCGHELEILQKFSDAPLVQCPACGEDQLQKLVSAASFRLKGGGWYETDFKKENKKHLADSGDKGSGATETAGNSDQKPGEQAKSTGKDSSAPASGNSKDKPATPAGSKSSGTGSARENS